jgi:hypothetical protein
MNEYNKRSYRVQLLLRLPLPFLIPPTAPHSSSIIRGWYNRQVRGRSLSLTHPTPRKKTKLDLCALLQLKRRVTRNQRVNMGCLMNTVKVQVRNLQEEAKGINSFIHQWPYSPLLGPDLLFGFVIFFTQTAGLLGRVIRQLQGCYLRTGQHKHRVNAQTNINVLSGIRTHDPSFRLREDSSCLTAQ